MFNRHEQSNGLRYNHGNYQRLPGYFNPQCESPYQGPSQRLAAMGYGNSMIGLPGPKRVRFSDPYMMSGALPYGGQRYSNDGGRYEQHIARYGYSGMFW